MRNLLPKRFRTRILRLTRRPAIGSVDFGDLRRLTPIGRAWGGDRGQPIDRYYIASFLAARADEITGRVLEVGDRNYTRQHGAHKVTESRIVTSTEDSNNEADYFADLTKAPQIPGDYFDCVICTQTLHLIHADREAVRTIHRILRPGGTVLATVPGIQINRKERGLWSDIHRYTVDSAMALFESHFDSDLVAVQSFGNVLSTTAFLFGLASEELTADELDYHDASYQTLIAVRATKS